MKPRFLGANDFEAVATRKTTGIFIFRRRIYKVRVRAGFALQDEDGRLWRPKLGKDGRRSYASDGGTIPPPICWFSAFDPLKYQLSCMGIHDPACADAELECMTTPMSEWRVVPVERSLADDLLRQGVIAEGGWRVTSGAYWCGVRVGAAVGVGVRK